MDERPTKWEIFRGWHEEQSFWRDIYTRAVSTLFAAALLFLIGLGGGVIKLSHRQIMRLSIIGADLVILAIVCGIILSYSFKERISGLAAALICGVLGIIGGVIVGFSLPYVR